MADETLSYKAEFDGSQILATLSALEGSFKQLDQTAQAGFKNLQASSESGFSVLKGVLQERILEKIGQGIKDAFQGAVGFIESSVKAAQSHEQIMRLVQASINATGGSAGVTADQLDKLAISFSKVTDQSRDQILQAEALALHYRNIAGSEIPAVVQASLDLAKAQGVDVKESMRSLAIAMQDPEAGLTRLRREGVLFSDQQKEQIKTLTESGDLLKAHAELLGVVESNYGHLAQNAADPFKQLQNEWNEIKIEIGDQFLPVIEDAARKVTAFLEAFDGTPAAKKLLDDLKESATIISTTISQMFAIFKGGVTDVDTLDGAFAAMNYVLKGVAETAIDLEATLKDIGILLKAMADDTWSGFASAFKQIGEVNDAADAAIDKIYALKAAQDAVKAPESTSTTHQQTIKTEAKGPNKDQLDQITEYNKMVLDSQKSLDDALANLDKDEEKRALDKITAERNEFESTYDVKYKAAEGNAKAIAALNGWALNENKLFNAEDLAAMKEADDKKKTALEEFAKFQAGIQRNNFEGKDPYRDQVEKLDQSLKEQDEIAEKAYKKGVISFQTYISTLDQIQKNHDQSVIKTEQEKDTAVLNASVKLADALANAELESLGKSKANAEAVKAIKVGMAIVDTYAAANTALASAPPPINFIEMAAVIVAGLANVGKITGAFYEGGYTGSGDPHEPAGIVHKGEYVVPHDVVSSSGGPSGIESRLGGGGTTNNYTGGSHVINIHAAQGQSADEIATSVVNHPAFKDQYRFQLTSRQANYQNTVA